MIELTTLLAQATPAVSLDGPETGLALWLGAFTLFVSTALQRLFVRVAANEKARDAAAYISPNVTSKARVIAENADNLALAIKTGEPPTEKMEALAKSISSKALDIMSGG